MLAESTESRLVTGTTDEEVLGLWTVGRRIVLGKLNPSMQGWTSDFVPRVQARMPKTL